jgi:hypothetical protein
LLAAVAGVFACAYVLQLVDNSRWTDSLSSVATVAATGVALYIATRDRSDRKADKLDADRAQARLVLLTVSEPSSRCFGLTVENHGTQPILAVRFDSARYNDGSHDIRLEQRGEDYDSKVFQVVRPHDESPPAHFAITHAASDSAAEALFATGAVSEYGDWTYPDVDVTKVTAAVTFTDAGGKTWRRSSSGLVEVITAGRDWS